MEFLQVQLNESQYSMQYYNNSLELPGIPGNRLEENRTKCGEIFATDSNSFNFLCTFCGTLFRDIDSFTQHMKIYHNISQSVANQFHTFLPESEIKIEREFADNNDDSVDLMKSEAIEEHFIDLQVSENFKQITEIFTKQIENVEIELESTEISQFTKSVKNCDKLQNNKIKQSIPHSSNKAESVTVKGSFQKSSDESVARMKNKPKSKRKRLRKSSVTYFCDICDKEFYKESVLKSHMMYDHNPTYPFLQNSTQSDINKEDLDDQMNEEKYITKINATQSLRQDPLKCRYCGRRFKTRVLRFEHECLHTGEKPHICNYCPKTFRTKRTLNEHLRIHENKKEFKCEICGVGFNCKTNLTVHIRRHKNERKHKCSFCDKTFICMTTKKTHERTHTGEKPYQCAECGRSFLTSSHLGVHIRRHTGEKPHKCEYCDKTFVTKEYMKRHQVIHGDERPFKCDVCSATFQRRGGLRQHKKIHSDVIGYVCNICGKGFKQFSGLYCHKKSHGENVALTQKS